MVRWTDDRTYEVLPEDMVSETPQQAEERADDPAIQPPTVSDHVYESTACLHARMNSKPELHNECRVICKFCMSVCTCECHVGKEGLS